MTERNANGIGWVKDGANMELRHPYGRRAHASPSDRTSVIAEMMYCSLMDRAGELASNIDDGYPSDEQRIRENSEEVVSLLERALACYVAWRTAEANGD